MLHHLNLKVMTSFAFFSIFACTQDQGSIVPCLEAADALDKPLVTDWLSKVFEEVGGWPSAVVK